MAETKEEKDEGARSFNVFLAQLCSGGAHSELTEELNSMLKELKAQALMRGPKGTAKGSLALKLNFTIEAKGVAGVTYDVTKKVPKPDREDDSFFLTKSANLTRKNPKQQELPLHDVSDPAKAGDAAATDVSSM